VLTQNPNPYNAWNVAPQPAFGFAWNPKSRGSLVVRGGFSLRKFTEPQQYVWNQASDYGSFYYQSFFLNAKHDWVPGPSAGKLVDQRTSIRRRSYSGVFTVCYGLKPAIFQKSEAASISRSSRVARGSMA